MKIAAMTTMALMAGTAAYAEPNVAPPERVVIVCMEHGDSRVPPNIIPRARMLASRMFAGIGVTVDWRHDGRDCPAEGILITASYAGNSPINPGILADARPYGSGIRVYYDRIAANPEKRTIPAVLAHVLVHEITHILQGVSRHSESGVMKAHWSTSDLTTMAYTPLRFADEDIDLIYRGLEWRAQRFTVLAKLDTPVGGR
jgi:hypothetical protein